MLYLLWSWKDSGKHRKSAIKKDRYKVIGKDGKEYYCYSLAKKKKVLAGVWKWSEDLHSSLPPNLSGNSSYRYSVDRLYCVNPVKVFSGGVCRSK